LPEGESGQASDGFRDALKLAKTYDMNYEVVDIAPAVAAMRLPQTDPSVANANDANQLLSRINIAPRIRAGMLYQIGQLESRRVVGTDNLAEQVTGYFTKWGDGAYDFNPLKYCTKSEVYILARELGVTREIVAKPPSAGLFGGQTDEEEMGLTYRDLDAWIMNGTCGNRDTDRQIQTRYDATAHKREMPYAYDGPKITGVSFGSRDDWTQVPEINLEEL